MKNYNESDFAKNKMNTAAIVYSHNGCTEILTFEKISESDPTITREEFEKFKQLSDEMFHEIFKNDDMESKYSVTRFNDEILDDITETRSPEDEYIDKANALLNEQSKRYRTSITPRNHMLSKMIYCKECGTMYRRKSNDINVYWVCRKKDQYTISQHLNIKV